MSSCPYPIEIVLPGGPKKGQKQVVPCGKCGCCLQSRRNDWAIRLKEEQRVSLNSYFVTLTYEESNLTITDTGFPTLVKSDLQKFLKRLRKTVDSLPINKFNYDMATDYSTHDAKKESNHGIRYYAVGEYGTRYQRPHYHLLLFNVPQMVLSRLPEIWDQGHVHCGAVNIRTIMYCLSYHITRDPNASEDYNRAPEFVTMSRRPESGIPMWVVSPAGMLRMSYCIR